MLDEILLKRAQYQKLKREIPDFRDNDYICCRINGESYTRTSFGRQFHSLLCMCGLPNIHWHDLRHIYASVLKNNSESEICFYILDFGIDNNNKEIIANIVYNHGKSIKFISVDKDEFANFPITINYISLAT